MTPLERLDASALKRVVTGYRDALRLHQDALNRLNVYPVPDGDTGTNMALTLESVVAALDGATAMDEVCKAISHGSLMGARGNSGVILSQILRGVATAFERVEAAGPDVLADGLRAAADAAYKAVMRPVEGTILTVAKAAGEAAFAFEGTSLADLLDAAKAAADDALARTPELLPVLKQAGVVDAGGAGYVLLLDVLLAVVCDRPIPEPPAPEADVTGIRSAEPRKEIDDAHASSIADLRYEVMFLLEAPDETIPRFKDVWMSVGDSIVVVGGDGLWNCHVHTDDIGGAIEAALDCGRPKRIRVTDLLEQVEEERWVREGAAIEEDAGAAADEDVAPPSVCAVVAVATGPGIRRIFRSLGVHQLVAGGQSMNPSTAQILEAVEAAPATDVVVLPNNKNIVPVAEQVDAHTSKTVRVVPTTSVAEGFAALLEYDPDDSAESNSATMRAAASRVVSGEVTRAVRASVTDAGPIAEGDYLGIARDGIRVVRASLAEAAIGLLEALVTDSHEIVTVIEGEGASAAVTRQLTEWLGEHRPDVTAELHHGGQPLYPYLFSIE